PASRALSVGLVNAVYPGTDALTEAVDTIAAEIAAKSPLAIAGTKLALNFSRDHSVGESLAQMAVLQSAIFEPQEIATSVTAMRTQRAPAFDDLSPRQPQRTDGG
ncbi:MAG TPA: hypothetical protein VLT59_12745, partial [Steroidobacteraceae bacterium]|nr:hypothetical protein [Steroidobacteraceae bacterium]